MFPNVFSDKIFFCNIFMYILMYLKYMYILYIHRISLWNVDFKDRNKYKNCITKMLIITKRNKIK